ncbi:MAG TPA: pirin family protein [Thermoanaerobaculia bacterium]|nr:pirin family protein [Thermoanaerobaculia bacterium]HQR66057.1 pirin family protein [Thermoanaerobaculia bacterium]
MITLRPAFERFHTDVDWLDSRHTFSFGEHYDPRHAGFRSLLVLNDDRVVAGGGFPTHGHRDMEIVSWVLEGALEHRDSLGSGSVLRPGMIQRMRAGTGIRHSEFNASKSDPLHFLQIWIVPEAKGLAPGYEEMALDPALLDGRLHVVAARSPGSDAVSIRQDAAILIGRLKKGDAVTHPIAPGRHAWVHVAKGSAGVNGFALHEGDGAAVSDEPELRISTPSAGEILVFDLA